jgi:Fe-S-cluster containining protein
MEIESTTAQPSFRSSTARAERFGFLCSRCSHCCHDKRIQINPYELSRLARNRDMDSREFQSRFTENGGGTHLARSESGACVFLGAQGCTVHPDRPLVCRVYPLGRHITSDGEEYFTHVVPHPLSRGAFHTDGTIADYLAAQNTEEFIRAADAYFWWFVRARAVLLAGAGPLTEGPPAPEPPLDMDGAIAAHQQDTGEPAPVDIEERRKLHMKILDRHLGHYEVARL